MASDIVNMVQHGSVDDALRSVNQALEQAKEAGKWMVAVWSVTNDQLNLVLRTTWQFPNGDVDEAVAQLKRTFATETPPAQILRVAPMPPLQVATSFLSQRKDRPTDADDDE